MSIPSTLVPVIRPIIFKKSYFKIKISFLIIINYIIFNMTKHIPKTELLYKKSKPIDHLSFLKVYNFNGK